MINAENIDYQNTPVSRQRPRFNYVAGDVGAAPQVSIVTPFFNTGQIFHETAHSVFQQSFQQWEWLIVNDGSTNEEALSVLEAYRDRDPRIRVIDQEMNGGPGAARNTAFSLARAPYLVQLDSDNLLEPLAIEIWFWFLQSFPQFGFVKGYTVGFGAETYLWRNGFHSGEAFLYSNQVDATAMLRKEVVEAVGGYDESIRDGLEDWDFWLRCANAGYWGDTIHQPLDWYRRRPSHTDRWQDWDTGGRQEAFRRKMRERYPALWNGNFPHVSDTATEEGPFPTILPCENRLVAQKPRLLMILPWLTMGGSDRFNLNLLRQLSERGWEVTIATTLSGDHSWESEFAAHTPDIFALHRFLRLQDYPRFLSYLLQSRQIDCVLISHSELGYQLLPYLRALHPTVAFVDYCHIEELQWKNGGYPRMAVSYQELLDLNIVASEHLKAWMVAEGAAGARIRTCYIGVDVPEERLEPEMPTREEEAQDAVATIVYAGRICEQKQPEIFAQTMLSLAQMGASFRAIVAGDGPKRAAIESFIKRNGLGGQVEIVGALPYEQMRELLASADIFFLPSMWEGISLAIYEAMASGLAVVGADVGGQRELVDDASGLLIRRGSAEEEVERYAGALAGLLKNPGRVKQMGKAGRERIVRSFRVAQMGERMTKLLREAIVLNETEPRPLPARGLAEATAMQAVEYVRMAELANRLWMERHGHTIDSHERSTTSWQELNWRQRLYLNLYRWHEPFYRRYSQYGWTWIEPLRAKVRQLLTH